jgi:hypothetical protein
MSYNKLRYKDRIKETVAMMHCCGGKTKGQWYLKKLAFVVDCGRIWATRQKLAKSVCV